MRWGWRNRRLACVRSLSVSGRYPESLEILPGGSRHEAPTRLRQTRGSPMLASLLILGSFTAVPASAACTMGQVSVSGFHADVDHWDGGDGGSVRISGQLSTYCITGTTVTLKILESDQAGKLLGSYDAVIPDVPAGGQSFDMVNAVPWIAGATDITYQIAGAADPHPNAPVQRQNGANPTQAGQVGPYAVPYAAPGYGAPGYPGYGVPGYGVPGYAAPGYGTPGYAVPGYAIPTFPVYRSPY